MDLLTSLRISASGLAAQKKRMAAISSNISNVETTRTAEGGPYRRKEVVFSAEPARESFADILEGEVDGDLNSVHASEVISMNEAPLMKYEPHHPEANEQGYVAYPNVNMMAEMHNLMAATRNYEANLSVMNALKRMAQKELTIGD